MPAPVDLLRAFVPGKDGPGAPVAGWDDPESAPNAGGFSGILALLAAPPVAQNAQSPQRELASPDAPTSDDDTAETASDSATPQQLVSIAPNVLIQGTLTAPSETAEVLIAQTAPPVVQNLASPSKNASLLPATVPASTPVTQQIPVTTPAQPELQLAPDVVTTSAATPAAHTIPVSGQPQETVTSAPADSQSNTQSGQHSIAEPVSPPLLGAGSEVRANNADPVASPQVNPEQVGIVSANSDADDATELSLTNAEKRSQGLRATKPTGEVVTSPINPELTLDPAATVISSSRPNAPTQPRATSKPQPPPVAPVVTKPESIAPAEGSQPSTATSQHTISTLGNPATSPLQTSEPVNVGGNPAAAVTKPAVNLQPVVDPVHQESTTSSPPTNLPTPAPQPAVHAGEPIDGQPAANGIAATTTQPGIPQPQRVHAAQGSTSAEAVTVDDVTTTDVVENAETVAPQPLVERQTTTDRDAEQDVADPAADLVRIRPTSTRRSEAVYRHVVQQGAAERPTMAPPLRIAGVELSPPPEAVDQRSTSAARPVFSGIEGSSSSAPAMNTAVPVAAGMPVVTVPTISLVTSAEGATMPGDFVAQTVAIVQNVPSGEEQRVTMRLDPPELGRIFVRIRRNSERLSVQIESDSARTLSVLREQHGQLVDSLATGVADSGQIDLSYSNGQQQGWEQAEEQAPQLTLFPSPLESSSSEVNTPIRDELSFVA